MFEGTYNCFSEEIKKELIPFNIQVKPSLIWSPFFWNWQFMCDMYAFERNGAFIKLASKIIRNENNIKKIVSEKIDYILPSNYKELSNLVCVLKNMFGIEFYNKEYFDDTNYLFDSLVNGYHINMTDGEVDTYCQQLCDLVIKKIEE